MPMCFLQYDSKSGLVAALVRPSEKKLKKLGTADAVGEFAAAFPKPEGADAVLLIADDAALPLKGARPKSLCVVDGAVVAVAKVSPVAAVAVEGAAQASPAKLEGSSAVRAPVAKAAP